MVSIIAPAVRLFRAGRDRFGVGGLAVFLLLIAAGAGFAWHLALGENPWDRQVPEKLAAGERLSIRDTIVCGLWAASAINLFLALVLLGLAGFWGRNTGTPRPSSTIAPASAVPGRLFWFAVLLAVVAGAWIRAPRLNQSFWNDEEQAFRKFTWGQHVLVEKDGEQVVKFQSNGWDRALFYSINGNNHVVHTAAAKASHQIWRSFRKNDDRELFSEAVIRIEPFVSGLLTIFLIGFWLRSLGFPIAGAAASWLLALHPWHLRYSVEARGYSALLLLVILAFWFLGPALRDKRWRWWLAYGAAQSLYLLCFAGAAYLAAAVNLIVLATLIRRRDGPAFWRWLVACGLGAMVFLQVMLAPAFRFINWVESPDVAPFAMDFAFFRDFWTHLTLGVPWAGGDPELHRFTSFRDEAARSVFRAAGLKVLLPLLLFAGAGFSAWRSPELRRFFAALIFAAALIWIHNVISDLVFFIWYALYLLLGFIVALALVPEMAAAFLKDRRLGSGTRQPAALAAVSAAVTAAVIVAGFAWLTHEPRSRLRSFDRHPMRQAVQLVRGESPALGSEQSKLLTASVGSGANQMRTYDPWLHWLNKEGDLDAILAEARESGKPLVVYCCSPRQVSRQMAGLYAKLEDRSVFEVETAEALKGLEEYWSYRIYRMKEAP